MDVSPHDRLVFSPPIPLVRGEGRDVRDQTLGSDLEVVGTKMGWTPPG
jgi:hypothetical protein